MRESTSRSSKPMSLSSNSPSSKSSSRVSNSGASAAAVLSVRAMVGEVWSGVTEYRSGRVEEW